MEITTKTITLVGVVSAAAVSVVALAIGNNEIAILGLGIVGTAIGVPVATNKLSTTSTEQPTQATEDTPSDLSTDDLAKEVDNSASLNDTSASTQPISDDAVNQLINASTGLSDEDLNKIVSGVAAVVNSPVQPTEANAEPTVLTQ